VHEMRDTDEAAEDLETRGPRMHIKEIEFEVAGNCICRLMPFTAQQRAWLRKRRAAALTGRCG